MYVCENESNLLLLIFEGLCRPVNILYYNIYWLLDPIAPPSVMWFILLYFNSRKLFFWACLKENKKNKKQKKKERKDKKKTVGFLNHMET